jgi:hypothetical protein
MRLASGTLVTVKLRALNGQQNKIPPCILLIQIIVLIGTRTHLTEYEFWHFVI